MPLCRFPNESDEYRARRNELLELEKDLRARSEAVADAPRATPGGIFHTWGSELVSHPMENGHPRHVDPVWLYWNLLDLTPDGRGDRSVPIQSYEHAYFSRHVLGGSGAGP